MIGRARRSGRSRLRQGPRPAAVVLAGVLTTVLIGAFVWLAENAYNGLPFLSYRTVYASLPNIGHLQQHDPVDIAGVRVGQVLRTATRNNRALVELQLQGVGPLPVDSKVVIRANGLLGARYLELDPGSSHRTLPNGATITEADPRATYTWGIPETLNLFDPKTRTALGNMLSGLGEGVMGRGQQLNQAIHVGPTSGANFDTAAYSILGRPGAAASFLPNTDSGVTALNSARENLASMFHPAAIGAQALVDRRSAVDSLISIAPSWELAVDRGLSQPATNVWNAGIALGTALDKVLPGVPQALRSATALLRAAPAPLRQTKTVLGEVPTASPAALNILAALRPDLAPLQGLFTNLVNPVTQLALHGCDIQSFASGTRSLVNFGATPGGNFGPNVGFPLTVIAGPQEVANIANTGFAYPHESPYNPPCNWSPGATLSNATILQTLSGVFGR